MDLSGIIFVVLAIGWAVYLLPKALKNHDDADQRRPVEEFSDSVRVLGRGAVPRATAPDSDLPPEVEPVETPAPVRTITREAARTAVRRRRRVLALLLSTLVALSVTSYLAYTPWFTTAIPSALAGAFLVVARRTVRAQQVRSNSASAPSAPAAPVALAPAPQTEPGGTRSVEMQHDVEPDLSTEDTQGLSRDEIAAAVAAPVLDEAGLWDPLPVTLPTYVNKPRARRTVRTVELTGAGAGFVSSGHDAADTALAAEAATAADHDTDLDEVVATPKAAGA